MLDTDLLFVSLDLLVGLVDFSNSLDFVDFVNFPPFDNFCSINDCLISYLLTYFGLISV